jgi:release factor glutamine methyltransferase
MQAFKDQVLSILRSTSHSKSPEAECERILFYVLRETHPSIHSFSDLSALNSQPSPNEASRILSVAQARAEGSPLQHLLGYQFFYSHDYAVDSSTLIPRPETEILIDEAIRWARRTFGNSPFQFAELGLGTGILSGELLSHFPAARGFASEVSDQAIRLSKRNLTHVVGSDYSSRFTLLKTAPSTGFDCFLPHSPVHLILSNPPYVSALDEIDPEVLRHEPASALFPAHSGPAETPSFFYLSFLEHAHSLLAPRGAAFFEIPHERADEIHRQFLQSSLINVRLIPDLTGRPRVIAAEAP